MDIAIAITANLVVSLVLVFAWADVLRTSGTVLRRVGAVVFVVLLAAFCAWGHDRLFWARLCPFSAVLFLLHPAPLLGGLLATAAWFEGLQRFAPLPKPAAGGSAAAGVSPGGGPTPGAQGMDWGSTVFQIAVWPVLLAVAALIFFLFPLLERYRGSTGREMWSYGVCLQTTDVTCSAASAATLLAQHGIRKSEAEMIDLCLTGRRGTPALGVYRGLVLATRGTPWRVKVLQVSHEHLLEATARAPVILSVGLPRMGVADPRYETWWGWTPGERHAVVCFGFREHVLVDVGDPSVGREYWRKEALYVLWRGDAMQLVPRAANAPSKNAPSLRHAQGLRSAAGL